MVRLVYFAWVREHVGVDGEAVDIPPTVATISDLATWLHTRGGGYGAAFADQAKLRCALDQVATHFSSEIGSAREIAFFPPVTGG